MIPAVVIPMYYSLAGKALTEQAEKRAWTGALTRRLRKDGGHVNTGGKAVPSSHGGALTRRFSHAGRLEKANPLPVGRYWIDVFDAKKSVWDAWLATANIATDPTTYTGPSDRVQVKKIEYYESFEDNGQTYPGRYWILFKVVEPTPWGVLMAEQLGWPNTAPGSIQTSDDTVQKPDPNDARTDWLPDVGPLGKITIAGTGILAVAVLAGYAVRSFR